MAEAKDKLTALQQRTGDYAGLPDKVYINNAEDANNIEIYGLNKGENDKDFIESIKEEWSSKNWFVSNGEYVLTDAYINGLYTVTPSTHCLWPIWKTFIDKSNGYLNNEGIYGQLSD